MGNGPSPAGAVATIAAMITPALLILGSASLVASALVRMARVGDRARTLVAATHENTIARLGISEAQLRSWLARHATRARYAGRSILCLYSAVVLFIVTCLSIALSRLTGETLEWLPIFFAIAGTLLLLGGGGWMVAESRMSGEQIAEEIEHALSRLEEKKT